MSPNPLSHWIRFSFLSVHILEILFSEFGRYSNVCHHWNNHFGVAYRFAYVCCHQISARQFKFHFLGYALFWRTDIANGELYLFIQLVALFALITILWGFFFRWFFFSFSYSFRIHLQYWQYSVLYMSTLICMH